MANEMQPIRDLEMLEKVKQELKKQNYRDYVIFVTGINTGLRISDILTLKVDDVRNKSHITIRETKTQKSKRFIINPTLRAVLNPYIENMEDHEYLFQSRKGDNQPISRVQAYRALKQVGDKLGIEEFATHTMRKTFGYHHYQQYKDVAILQEIFNHSAPSITLRYIGITQDEIDQSYNGFGL